MRPPSARCTRTAHTRPPGPGRTPQLLQLSAEGEREREREPVCVGKTMMRFVFFYEMVTTVASQLVTEGSLLKLSNWDGLALQKLPRDLWTRLLGSLSGPRLDICTVNMLP
ncbi:uncharacterized protein AAEQ78_024638 isoform 1-T1 [Lycaon pictus]